MSDKILDFWGSGQEPEVPDYITKEELIAASQDCSPYKIIETDREKIRRFCLKLEAHDLGANGLAPWLELISEIFGFIIFNQIFIDSKHKLLLFVFHSTSVCLYSCKINIFYDLW